MGQPSELGLSAPPDRYAGSMQLPSLDEMLAAQEAPATPQYAWPLLNRRLGTEAAIKHENQTPVGARTE